MEEHGIRNKEDLKEKLGQGDKFYTSLKDVTTTKGKTTEPVLISERLQDSLILEQMTDQVAQKAQVPEKEVIVKMEDVAEVAESLTQTELVNITKDIRCDRTEEKDKKNKDIEEQDI